MHLKNRSQHGVFNDVIKYDTVLHQSVGGTMCSMAVLLWNNKSPTLEVLTTTSGVIKQRFVDVTAVNFANAQLALASLSTLAIRHPLTSY